MSEFPGTVCPHDYNFRVWLDAVEVWGTCDTPEKFAYLCAKVKQWQDSNADQQGAAHD